MSKKRALTFQNNNIILDNYQKRYELKLKLSQNFFKNKDINKANSMKSILKPSFNIKKNSSKNNDIKQNFKIENTKALNSSISREHLKKNDSFNLTNQKDLCNNNILTIKANKENNINNNNNLKIETKDNNLEKNEINNYISSQDKKTNQKSDYGICFLCERTYKLKLLFSSKCQKHTFCKECLNSYFEGLIQNNQNLSLECPLNDCNGNFELKELQKILDENIYNEISLVKTYNKSKSVNINGRNLAIKNSLLYSKRSVIDMNSKDELMKSLKDIKYFCPKCSMNIALYKTNTHFYKCLSCYYKICKYCHKEYTPTHLISNEKDYCKAYCRTEKNNKKNYFKLYLGHLIFVIVMYILCFIAAFIFPFKFFKNKFNIKRENKYICLKIISCIISIFIMIILIPLIILFLPYFPYFIAIFDL